MLITDQICRLAIEAMKPDRIQGFSTLRSDGTWGAPHYIRDVFLRSGAQELWRGDSHDEMMEQCEIEKMRLALTLALQEAGLCV